MRVFQWYFLRSVVLRKIHPLVSLIHEVPLHEVPLHEVPLDEVPLHEVPLHGVPFNNKANSDSEF